MGVVRTIRELLSEVERSENKAGVVDEMYSVLATNINWVRAHENFFETCRHKLVELVAHQGYEGQRFFNAFEVDIDYLLDYIRFNQ
jgi:hypothetical protein